MFAIVEVASRQYKMGVGDVVELPISYNKNQIILDKVLMTISGKEIEVGSPYLRDIKVVCDVVGTKKDKKAVTIKFKRRKGYHRKIGSRSRMTTVKVREITAKSKE